MSDTGKSSSTLSRSLHLWRCGIQFSRGIPVVELIERVGISSSIMSYYTLYLNAHGVRDG